VAKPNYHQARKQRELARKARQLEKQQRKGERARVNDVSSQVETPQDDGTSAAAEPVAGER
jgi:hypothetical protein